uniref:Ovule protein n=1 Tax=Brugia timori TaxID=42155 RepID=A0A0R3RBE9_9BILA
LKYTVNFQYAYYFICKSITKISRNTSSSILFQLKKFMIMISFFYCLFLIINYINHYIIFII